MFAAATREVVFSNAEVIRRIKQNFIPVALKAGLVNNPPRGVEGKLYSEIKRTRPAPQGICVVNSSGQVLAWALSFDDDQSIPAFLEFATERHQKYPDDHERFAAVRFMRYPSRRMEDVRPSEGRLVIPDRHNAIERCPALRPVPPGTLVGRVIGRALDDNGEVVTDTIRQEHYMESRFEISTDLQARLADVVSAARGQRFRLPQPLTRSLVSPAFLGQLDVDPLGGVPGSQNHSRWWRFFGEQVEDRKGMLLIRITGRSHVAGGPRKPTGDRRRSDGRSWEHAVSLDWQRYIEMQDDRVQVLDLIAHGRERLRWGNSRLQLTTEVDAAHLMAGHPINLECGVRYGLHAEPVASPKAAADTPK